MEYISLEGFVQNFKTLGMNFTTSATTTILSAMAIFLKLRVTANARDTPQNIVSMQMPHAHNFQPLNCIPQEHNIHIYTHIRQATAPNFQFFYARTPCAAASRSFGKCRTATKKGREREKEKKNNQFSYWLDLHFILLL